MPTKKKVKSEEVFSEDPNIKVIKPNGNYYTLRKTDRGLWTIDLLKYKDGVLLEHNPQVTAPDLQVMSYMKLERIFEQEFVR